MFVQETARGARIDTGSFRARGSRLVERLAILAGGGLVLWLLLSVDLGPSKLSLAREVLGPLFPFVAWPAAAMAAVVGVSSVWRLVLWAFYRPLRPLAADDPRLPAITVVIPAYNEGRGVAGCMRSVLASDYPADRLRIVAVDDGSTDDTLAHMRAAAAGDPRVQVLGLPRNQGKRAALYEGFKRASTPIVVTVDSDTEVPRESLRALVTPLVVNAKVGAVAGRIEVLDRDRNLLTRMLAVRYRIGFDFVRAYQSRLSSVFVCPGAFTAYRMDALEGGLCAWREQRFLGRRCSNGDDHNLTNLVLKNGYSTVYQGNAPAFTAVPHTYKGLSLMYLRWARSNIRESLVYLGFAPRLLAHPRNWPAAIDALTLIVQIPLRLYLLLFGYGLLVLSPALFLRSIAAALLYALVHMAVYLRSERNLDAAYTLLYAVFSLLTLQWVYPWAAATVRQSRWLTR